MKLNKKRFSTEQHQIKRSTLIFLFLSFTTGAFLIAWQKGVKWAIIYAAVSGLILLPFAGLSLANIFDTLSSETGNTPSYSGSDGIIFDIIMLGFYLVLFLIGYITAFRAMFTSEYNWRKAGIYFLSIILGTLLGTSLGFVLNMQ
ncbi:MAG: hypothetical protein RMX68_026640 [Aulosira sp. ZfuVER01]|nr:hypothetical protein [Aulosira sp. ZfuVER01]MDZ8000130.1 hypothetical protein [Aulosira sp. DedVER01a]MDZ8055638.1 hypothetical protein [Aulosira sp. ZfuCHP01]